MIEDFQKLGLLGTLTNDNRHVILRYAAHSFMCPGLGETREAPSFSLLSCGPVPGGRGGLTLLSLLQTIMSENSDGGGGSQISALDDLLAGGVAGSASVIVGRELDLP